MNRIEQLIAELCPDGVEYRTVNDVCKVSRGRVISKDFIRINHGNYPVYSSQTANDGILGTINSFDFDGEFLTWTTDGAYAGSVFYRNGKFSITNVCGLLEVKENALHPRFLLYYLNIVAKKYVSEGMGNPKLMSNAMAKIPIPIPPLPIQQEIVRILDTFTDLDAELQAELEARKKQYEHYRNQLLNFEGKEVEWKTLGEVGKVCMCKRVMKHETNSSGEIPFYKIGTFGKEANAYISRELYDDYKKKFSFPCKGDILISASGTIGRRVIYDDKPAYFQDSNIIWLSLTNNMLLNKYLYYIYETIEWPVEGGTIKRLYNDNFKKIKIPIPPLTEQERIVTILDKFEALVNEELPAEIAARRKQYEYYREKLLTFEPLIS